MKTKFKIFAILLLLTNTAISQTIRFEKYFTKGYYGGGASVIKKDNNYFIAAIQGNASSLASMNVYFIKTNLWGDTICTKIIDNGEADRLYAMALTNDNNIICAGSYQNSNSTGNEEIYLVKFNLFCDTIWTKKINPTNTGIYPLEISVLQNGDMLISGFFYTSTGGAGCGDNKIGFLMLLDSLGSQNRFRSFGYSEKINTIRDFCLANNNCLIISGTDTRSANYYSNSDDPYIAKLDSNWNFVWFKWLGERDDDDGGSLIKLSDGNYIAMVSSLKDEYYAREKLNFLKFSEAGNILIDKKYDIWDTDYFTEIILCSDGGFAIVGISYSNGFLLKLNSTGDSLWCRNYGGNKIYDIKQTSDGGFIMTGQTYSYNPASGGSSVLLLKVDNLGLLVLGENELNMFNDIELKEPYPNPCIDFCTIEFKISKKYQNAKFLIFNIQGKQLLDESLNLSQDKLKLEMSAYTKGTYLGVLVVDGYNVGEVKIVKE